MFAFRALLRLTCITLIVQLHVRSAVIPDQNEKCNQDVVYVSSLADAPLHRTQSGCVAVADFTYVGQQSYLTLTSQGSSQKNVVNVWRTRRTGDHVVFLAYEEVEYSQEVDPWSRRISSILGHADGGPSAASDNVHKAQKTLQHHPHSLDRPVTLMLNDTFAVVRLASLKALSDLSDKLPRDTRLTRLVRANLDIESQNVLVSLPAPTFKPPLHALLFSKTLDVPFLQNDARILSGEDKVGQSIPLDQADDSVVDLDLQHWGSRHSATPEARLAAAWIRARLARDLAPLRASCIEWKYDEIFSPNVICTIPAQPAAEKDPAKDQGIVVISAHYDSRGTFGSVKAPGADDDGSGTTMLLALARHLGSHKVTFEREVRLVAFSGEEQGLVGSQHYAAHLRNQSIPVHFQLQTDMIGYRKPGEPLQVAFPDKLATESATQYVMSIARMYVPELQLGYTPACCSDHQSFWEQGYTSTWIFERRGPIADPCYHDSCDRTDRPGYDFDQIRASTRLVLATLLDVAGGVRWPW